MLAKEIGAILEEWAPPYLAESYDNVGLLVGNPEQEVKGVLINLDMTEEVVDEAIERGLNMVVAHHPIWFSSRKRLNGEDYVSRTIMKAIKHDVLLYAFHTNLDNIRTGVNKEMAERLQLTDVQILHPKKEDDQVGAGMIGNLDKKVSKGEFLQRVKEAFQCGGIRFADAEVDKIQRVAICGGAGSFLTSAAIALGADAFVTADITYHKFFDNENKILLLDIGHYESEQYTSGLIARHLLEKIPNFAIHLSKIRTNPVNYYP
ncbi:MAG: Nif3-like dinuclear metal center hexameric protein [Bacteroidia bacterium]|nr:Nif3-like dinuclear metal center hexameric protein [Bacteroidia bacterium]